MIYHIFIFVVNITPMLLAHGNKFKSVNSNKQKVLKSIGKQFNVDNKRVITTDIKRTAIIIACRSNGALIAPFVTSDSDTWKAKVDRLNGDNVASVYVTFFYFE